MIKRKLQICLLAMWAAASTGTYALGISPWTTVDEIIQGLGSNPVVQLAMPGDAATGCAGSNRLRFVDADSSVGKRHFSTLLAALSSGKEVRIRTRECSSDYPYIDHIYIKR